MRAVAIHGHAHRKWALRVFRRLGLDEFAGQRALKRRGGWGFRRSAGLPVGIRPTPTGAQQGAYQRGRVYVDSISPKTGKSVDAIPPRARPLTLPPNANCAERVPGLIVVAASGNRWSGINSATIDDMRALRDQEDQKTAAYRPQTGKKLQLTKVDAGFGQHQNVDQSKITPSTTTPRQRQLWMPTPA